MTLVAVYGSLRKGLHNHSLIDADYESQEKIQLPLTMVSLGGFPALVTGEGINNNITVETYWVDDITFRRLDQLEGYPHFYNRKQVETSQGRAWIYYMDSPVKAFQDVVVDGDWADYYKEVRYG
jgi:gamma-glutamylcyclotransferase (GGCT)/AIG2-like uncharacterized protein YtfP